MFGMTTTNHPLVGRRVRIVDGAIIGQDHNFAKWSDKGEDFLVIEKLNVSDRSEFILQAPGYGDSENYGNGALYVLQKDLIEVDGSAGQHTPSPTVPAPSAPRSPIGPASPDDAIIERRMYGVTDQGAFTRYCLIATAKPGDTDWTPVDPSAPPVVIDEPKNTPASSAPAVEDARVDRAAEVIYQRCCYPSWIPMPWANANCEVRDACLDKASAVLAAADAVPAPAPAVDWTSEPPKEPGWYWACLFGDTLSRVTRIFKLDNMEIWCDGPHGACRVDLARGEWWPVPISEPPKGGTK
jgi:hypothetical protein